MHIELPDELQKISNSCFRESGLQEITMPKYVKILEEYAFHECIHLTTIYLPDTLESIEEHCFQKCGLVEIRVPNSV